MSFVVVLFLTSDFEATYTPKFDPEIVTEPPVVGTVGLMPLNEAADTNGEKQMETERETERGKDRKIEEETERGRERQRDRGRERQREGERDRE